MTRKAIQGKRRFVACTSTLSTRRLVGELGLHSTQVFQGTIVDAIKKTGGPVKSEGSASARVKQKERCVCGSGEGSLCNPRGTALNVYFWAMLTAVIGWTFINTFASAWILPRDFHLSGVYTSVAGRWSLGMITLMLFIYLSIFFWMYTVWVFQWI